MLLLVSLACIDFYPEDTTPAVEQPTSCDTEVRIPTGSLGGSPDRADAHQEQLGAAPTPYHVHLGWPSRSPSNSAAFMWRTDTDTLASQVKIGTSDGFPNNATIIDGYSFLFGGGSQSGIRDSRTWCGGCSSSPDSLLPPH